MTKKKPKKLEAGYEYVRAIVEHGNLRWEYKLKGLVPTSMYHDEDVSGWSEGDIITLTRSMLSMHLTEDVTVIYS